MAVCGEIDFIQDHFFGIKPRSKVVQIGDGRENGCYRTDRFKIPFSYSGSFLLQGIKYYAFQVPSEMLTKNSIPHYILYESTGSEPLRRKRDYVRFFYPIIKTKK